jgi:6-phosphogluconolactonase
MAPCNGPYGVNLCVANAGSDNVSVYPIDVNTGALAGPFTFPTGKSPTSIAVDPFGGSIVFVANHGGSNDISAFNCFDLTPVPGSPFPAGGNPLSLAVGAGGAFLYSANPDATNPSISGFSIDPNTGALSPLSGSPYPLPVSHYIATDQTGAYLYVTSGANVVGYGIDATTGALTALPGFPVSAGANAYSITVDPTNEILYVTNDGAANVSGFTLDASTGALTPMSGSPLPAGNRPQFLATF